MLEDTAHDAVASAVYLDAGLVAVNVVDVRDSVSMYFTILEFDAVGDALHVLFGDILVGPDVIYFLFDKFGMCEFAGEVAVVGEQEYAGGVTVETANGIDAFLASVLDEVEHGGTAVGVVGGGDAVFRLVEEYVAFTLRCYHFAVVFDNVGGGFYLYAEFFDSFAIDGDESLCDKFVGLSTRADAGVGHIFVESYFCIGVDIVEDVVDLIGSRSKCLLTGTVVEAAGTIVIAVVPVLVSALLALLIAALLTGLVSALLALLISTLLTGLVAVLLTRLVTTLLTGLVATLLTRLTGLVAVLLTGLVTVFALLTRLICALLAWLIAVLLAWLVATLLAWLIAVLAGLVSTLLAGLIATLLSGMARLVTVFSLLAVRSAGLVTAFAALVWLISRAAEGCGVFCGRFVGIRIFRVGVWSCVPML